MKDRIRADAVRERGVTVTEIWSIMHPRLPSELCMQLKPQILQYWSCDLRFRNNLLPVKSPIQTRLFSTTQSINRAYETTRLYRYLFLTSICQRSYRPEVLLLVVGDISRFVNTWIQANLWIERANLKSAELFLNEFQWAQNARTNRRWGRSTSDSSWRTTGRSPSLKFHKHHDHQP